MDLTENQLNDADFNRIAALHSSNLNDSLISALGPGIVRAYYKFILGSSDNNLFVEREDNSVVGACVLSHAPYKIMSKFIRSHFLAIAVNTAIRFVLSGKSRARIINFLASKDVLPDIAGNPPELVQIFIDTNYRNRKIGSKLLVKVEQYLKQKNIPAYYLKTLDDKDNQALHFYNNRGFKTIGSGSVGNRPYIFFLKFVP
jgi:ribosomal protein S18 acetylase RimI-like enzyme